MDRGRGMMTDDRIPVLVVAGDPLLRAGVDAVLNCQDVELLDEQTTARRAVAVIVVDTVDDDAVREVKASVAEYGSAVLVATSVGGAGALAAVEAGVAGVLRRSQAGRQALVSAVRAAAAGQCTVPPDVLAGMFAAVSATRPVTGPPDDLDDRERAVLSMVADGHETAEIARTLAYSTRTVTGVVHDITTRWRLRNRAHAVAYALRHGLI